MTECGYELIECENECCDSDEEIIKIMRKDSENHLLEECPKRLVKCELCDEEGKHCDITGYHVNFCLEVLVECDNEGCEETMKRCKDDIHEKVCQYALVNCKYVKCGCLAEIRRKDLQDHERDVSIHLAIASKTIKSLKERLDALENSDLLSKISLARQLEAVKNMDRNVRKVHDKVERLKPTMLFRPVSSKLDSALLKPLDNKQGLVVATFKIEDYKSHMENKTVFHSPPFYTSPDGYKIKVRVGHESEDYLSIYLNIENGKNDDCLPITISEANIEVELLNQEYDYDHLSIHIGKKKRWSRFWTNKADSDIAIKRLRKEHTLNDTLYFRVTVHKMPTAEKPWLVCTV